MIETSPLVQCFEANNSLQKVKCMKSNKYADQTTYITYWCIKQKTCTIWNLASHLPIQVSSDIILQNINTISLRLQANVAAASESIFEVNINVNKIIPWIKHSSLLVLSGLQCIVGSGVSKENRCATVYIVKWWEEVSAYEVSKVVNGMVVDCSIVPESVAEEGSML